MVKINPYLCTLCNRELTAFDNQTVSLVHCGFTHTTHNCGNSSVGRAAASQAAGREFEPRLPLQRHQIGAQQLKSTPGNHTRCAGRCFCYNLSAEIC